MRRPIVLLAALVVSLAVSVTPANAVRFKDIPPDLQALLLATLHLQINGFSERQVVTTTRHGHQVPVSRQQSSCRTAPAPPECQIIVSGTKGTATERIVGQYAYVSGSGLARLAGGHSWVREPDAAASVASTMAGGVELLLENDLSAAAAVHEIGQTYADGQAVTEFVVQLPAFASLALYVAPNGVVVRQVTTSSSRITTIDVSLDPPVSVSAPPSRNTIAWSRLTSAQRRAIDRLSL